MAAGSPPPLLLRAGRGRLLRARRQTGGLPAGGLLPGLLDWPAIAPGESLLRDGVSVEGVPVTSCAEALNGSTLNGSYATLTGTTT